MTAPRPDPNEAGNQRLMTSATYASATVAFVLIVLKTLAWNQTGSVSLLAALLDSLFDGIAAIITLVAVRIAITPADREHRFGHGKAEALAGYCQAIIIFISALIVTVIAVERLLNPVAVESSTFGIAVLLIAIFMTLALVSYQNYVVRRTQSLAIRADALHYKSDLILNGGAILGLTLSAYGIWPGADAVIALLLVVWIVYKTAGMCRDSIDQLMDREMANDDRNRIRSLVAAHPDVHNLHDLRTRRSGRQIMIQMHLELDGNLSLYHAHRIADAVEDDLMQAFPEAEIFLHQDPFGIETLSPLERADRVTAAEAEEFHYAAARAADSQTNDPTNPHKKQPS